MSEHRPSRRAFLACAAGAVVLPRAAESFADTIATLSTPESGPPADNLVTNEDSFPRVVSDLARLAPRDSVYLGVGPDQNLTYMAHARPAVAFILDHRRRNLLLHLVHKALLTLADDRAGYLSRLTARAPSRPLADDATADDLIAAFAPAPFDRARLDATVAEVARALRPLGVVADDEWPAVATIQAKLAGPGLEARFLALRMYPTFARLIATRTRDGKPAHFLGDERLYQSLRDAERADRVIPLVGDFAGPKSITGLAEWLRRRGRSVGVLYISDVEFFLLRSGKFPAYIANLDRLPWADGAVVVRTSTRPIESPERVDGDSSTTVVRPVERFLAEARRGRITSPDDLFRPGGSS